jgi:hypothetical protein
MTISRHLQDLGMKYYIRPPKPKLTTAQKKKRLAFAKAYSNTNWSTVIFSDEKDWNIFHPGKMGVWVLPGDPVPPRETVKFQRPIKTWAAFSVRGKSSLLEYKGNVRAPDYQQIVNDGLLPLIQRDFRRGGYLFQQDGATPHTTRSTQTWLQNHNITQIPPSDWPPNSPDLNPLENVWGILQSEMDKTQITTREKYWKFLKTKWDEFPKSTLKDIIESMPRRLKEVIKKKGEATQY